MATTLDTQRLNREWKTIRDRVHQRWGQLSDDDLIIHGHNVEQFLNRLHKVTGAPIPEIESFLAELLYGGSAAADRYAVEARERLQEGAAQATRLVRSRPTGSVATAVGLGLIVGVLVGLSLRR
ncbi:MAG TPA: hypothetical protein VF590_22025 [Isosphaeraceae bacterium]